MLADSGEAWTGLVAQHNSGTYNNQYVVVDLKRFRPGKVHAVPTLHHPGLISQPLGPRPRFDLGFLL